MRVRWRSVPTGVLFLIAAVSSSERASGAERWLTLEPSQRCAAKREVLASRIAGALAGTRDPELVVHVELADAVGGTTARVRLARGSRELGTKRIEASRCEEALDAVVAIAALALGTPLAPAPLPSAEGSDVATRAMLAQEWELRARVAHELAGGSHRELHPEGHDRGASQGDPSSPLERWRLLWRVGVGRGSLAATPFVGAGVGVELGRSELRGSLEYGLPSSHEFVDTSVGLGRSRSDFATATFDACHALDEERWLSVCAALEARVTRWSQVETPVGQQRVEHAGLEPAALAGGGVSIAYAAATWRPRLDVSAQLPIAGTPWDGDTLGIRAAVGASLPF